MNRQFLDHQWCTNGVRKFWWFVFGRINKLTNNLNGRCLAGAGKDAWSSHDVRALLLGQAAHNQLQLTAREEASERKNAGSNGIGLSISIRIIEN